MRQTLPVTILCLVLILLLCPALQLSAQTCTATASANTSKICQGQSVVLTGAALFPVLSWQWYREGEATPVSTSQSFNADIPGKYKLVATGSQCGEVESDIVELFAVNMPATPGPVSGPAEVCAGSEAIFQVSPAEGADAYTWTVPTNWQIIYGQGTSTIKVSTGNESGTISVFITNACGASASSTIAVQVSSVVSANTISGNQFICTGQVVGMISGSLPTGGNGTYLYQWEKSVTSPDAGFSMIAGANGQHYQPQSLWQTTWFRRKVTNNCGQSVSNAVKVMVYSAPSAPTANNVNVAYGTSATLSVTSPQPTLTYRWFNSASGGSPVASGVSYFTNAMVANTTYYVEAISAEGCVSGRTAVTVTVNTVIGNNVVGSDQDICAGHEPIALSGSEPTGGNGAYAYQWEHSSDGADFTAIPEANTKSYTPGALSQSTWFRRKVITDAGVTSISNSVKITILPIPEAPKVENITVCTGYRATLKVWQPDPGFTYRWYLIGRESDSIEGVAITTVPITTDTAYFVEAVNLAGCVSPRTKYIVRNVLSYSDNIVGEPQEVCYGETPAMLGGLAPQNGSTHFEYFWEASTDGVSYTPAPFENNSKYYKPGALTQTTWFRRSIVSEYCPISVSEPVKITVLTKPPKPSISKGATTLTASITGVTYVWQKDGIVLPDAVTQSITIDAGGIYRVSVQNGQGCFSDFSEPLAVTPLPSAVAVDAANAGIAVSPNPASGRFMVHTKQPFKQAIIAVYNLAGKEVYRKTESIIESQFEVDLSDSPAGMYVLIINTGQRQFTKRIAVVN